MTRAQKMQVAGLGSLALLAGAFAFQYIGGLAPCKLCLWQRWPHGLAGLIGLGVLLAPVALARAPFAALGGLGALASAGLGLYHTGVERAWWAGPDTCTGGPLGGQAPGDLLNAIMAAPLVRCDEVAWSMLGLSMASWNALASLALALLWFSALKAAPSPKP